MSKTNKLFAIIGQSLLGGLYPAGNFDYQIPKKQNPKIYKENSKKCKKCKNFDHSYMCRNPQALACIYYERKKKK